MGTGVWVVLNKSTWDLWYLFNVWNIWIIINILLIVFVFFWIASIIRVLKDISARTDNAFLQIVSMLCVTLLTPVFGLPLYLIIRPIYYKKDKMLRREAVMADVSFCLNCNSMNSSDNEHCVNCGEPIKIWCKQCASKYNSNYKYCPDCGAPNIEIE